MFCFGLLCIIAGVVLIFRGRRIQAAEAGFWESTGLEVVSGYTRSRYYLVHHIWWGGAICLIAGTLFLAVWVRQQVDPE